MGNALLHLRAANTLRPMEFSMESKTMTVNKFVPKPEIMSPAGYWPQLLAAIEAGADAVYFGLNHFSARGKVGFTLVELPEVMRTLHRRGVKGYVTFNTLVFDHELSRATEALAEIAAAGADSVIVQDVAIAQLAGRIAPDLAIHGSTQMSITSAEGIALAQSFGVSRVVMARELSLADVRAIREQTDCELEMFVHGALCVSYSGQCFSSEAWGGRSANRGQCAQACRLPYEMIVDDILKPLEDARYLLSPGDLYALQQMPEIVEIGISALKIEGRYKDADYVALTTQAYRQAVDEAWAGLPLSIEPTQELKLEQIYSRGLGPYFVNGTNHQAVVDGRFPGHRGVLIGQVTYVGDRSIQIKPEAANDIAPLKAGDGVVFDAADWRSPTEHEEGGRVYHVWSLDDGQLELDFAYGSIDFERILVGDLLWRTDDPELDREVKQYTQAATPVYRRPVSVRIIAHEGAPLLLHWTLDEHPKIQAIVQSDEPLATARTQGLTAEFARGQLERLGNTPYVLSGLELDIEGNPFTPSSLLNGLRRQAVDLLKEQQNQPKAVTLQDPAEVLAAMGRRQSASLPASTTVDLTPQLHVLVRTPEQLNAAIDLAPASITLDYLDLYGLRPAVERVQASGITARVASPRILKPNEQRIVNFLLRLNCQILVRSGGLLQALQENDHPELIGDFSLNAANAISADTFIELGLHRLTPTHDLNADQVAELARTVGPEQFEVVAYQHLPVFHTEHCVFCRFLSEGTSIKDCGHPCESHRVALRDVHGRAHPVLADVGCRNTVFGAEAQEASLYLDRWREAGIRHYRLEFVDEGGEAVTKVARLFRKALDNQLTTEELTIQLSQVAPQGTTEGSLFVPNDFMELPVL